MKKFLFVIVCLSACLSLSGKQLKQVSLLINRDNGIYAKGEKVVVSAKAEPGFEGDVSIYVLLNGKKVLEKDIELGTEPSVIYEGCYDRPLCGMVYAHLRDNKKVDTGVGFAVAPEELRPGYQEPADYCQFWQDELRKMRSVKPEVTLSEVDPGEKYAEKYVCYSLEISMHEGWPARGYLAMPRDAAKKSLPIVMYFHGAGVNKKACRSTVKTALWYASQGGGCIALDINAHGMLNDQPQEYYDDLAKGVLKEYRTAPITTREAFYYKDMMLRDVRALDYLCTLKEWDGERVLVTGSSQGGMQSCCVAALDSRVKKIVAIVPGFSDMGAAYAEGRETGWTRTYRNVAKYPNAKDVVPYFDTCNALHHTDADLWMEVGFIDQTCNAEGMLAAFNGAAMKNKQIFTYPYRRHSIKKDDQYYKPWKESVEKLRKAYMKEYLK